MRCTHWHVHVARVLSLLLVSLINRSYHWHLPIKSAIHHHHSSTLIPSIASVSSQRPQVQVAHHSIQVSLAEGSRSSGFWVSDDNPAADHGTSRYSHSTSKIIYYSRLNNSPTSGKWPHRHPWHRWQCVAAVSWRDVRVFWHPLTLPVSNLRMSRVASIVKAVGQPRLRRTSPHSSCYRFLSVDIKPESAWSCRYTQFGGVLQKNLQSPSQTEFETDLKIFSVTDLLVKSD